MTPTILYSVISLSALGALAALILYIVAQRFKVYEDPRIDEVEEALPAANCGACGFPGCRNFAEAVVKADNIDDFYCPVGGNETMKQVAKILGKEPVEQEAKVAVVRCNGSFQNLQKKNEYDGPASCALEHNLYKGESDCQYGCLGHGDCVEVCDFEAIYMSTKTGLPVVIDDNCTACGLCVDACPRNIIELRKRARKDRKVYVACMNKDKGAAPKKACKAACIDCKLCQKECRFDAITIEDGLAYIHADKCTLCRECVPVCPTGAILEANFPPRKKKKAASQGKKSKSKVGSAKSGDSTGQTSSQKASGTQTGKSDQKKNPESSNDTKDTGKNENTGNETNTK